MECGGLDDGGQNRLIESDTMGRGGLAGICMALLKEVCHSGWVWGFQNPSLAQCHSLLLLLAAPEVELSTPFPAPCPVVMFPAMALMD